MTDELERRLRAADPAGPSTPIEPARSERARSLVEGIMDTPVIDTTPGAGTAPRRRILAAAAAVVVAAGIGVAALSGGTDSEPEPATRLALGASDPMAMCLAFDPAVLAQAPIAFDGTVTEVGDGVVTLEVSRWYSGESGDVVELTHDPGPDSAALIDGFEMAVDGRYLISADGTTVNLCGFSGPWSPELEAGFQQAFPG